LHVQQTEVTLSEDMPVPDPTRSHLCLRFVQPLVDRARPHMEPVRDFTDVHPVVVEDTNTVAGEGQSMSAGPPTFPRRLGPSEYGQGAGRWLPPHTKMFGNGTARESHLVQADRLSLGLCRVLRHRLPLYGQPVHASSAN